MNYKIDINKYIDNDVNLIEIYLIKNNEKNENSINVSSSDKLEQLIDNIYKKNKVEKYISYYNRDKVYTYELSNDNQYVYTKFKRHLDIIDNILVVASKHDKQPNYTFPCTNDIDNISQFTIKEYKISYRISLFIRYDNNIDKTIDKTIKTIYIEYKHSQNVDIDKINEQINKIITKISNC
jgi:hypothetical protein